MSVCLKAWTWRVLIDPEINFNSSEQHIRLNKMPSPVRVMNLMQTLIDGEFSLVKIATTTIQESDITSEVLSVFDHARPLGISPGYSSAGKLVAIAIADDHYCKIIELNAPHASRRDGGGRSGARLSVPRNLDGLQLLQEMIFCRHAGELFAFDMGPLSMSLYCDTNLRIINAVDIQSGASAVDRKPLTAIKAVVGTTVPIMENNISDVFRNPVYNNADRNRATDLAMRAWISQFLAGYGNGAETLAKVQRIDTRKLTAQVRSRYRSGYLFHEY